MILSRHLLLAGIEKGISDRSIRGRRYLKKQKLGDPDEVSHATAADPVMKGQASDDLMESAVPATPASDELTSGLGVSKGSTDSSTIRKGNKPIKHNNSCTYKKSIEID